MSIECLVRVGYTTVPPPGRWVIHSVNSGRMTSALIGMVTCRCARYVNLVGKLISRIDVCSYVSGGERQSIGIQTSSSKTHDEENALLSASCPCCSSRRSLPLPGLRHHDRFWFLESVKNKAWTLRDLLLVVDFYFMMIWCDVIGVGDGVSVGCGLWWGLEDPTP